MGLIVHTAKAPNETNTTDKAHWLIGLREGPILYEADMTYEGKGREQDGHTCSAQACTAAYRISSYFSVYMV